jgi:enhancer of mRNA-decapping protein 3
VLFVRQSTSPVDATCMLYCFSSASDTCSSQKNGFKGANNKLADRHGVVGSCIRENDCFSMPVDSFASDEFDFEKNLAMFDKRAVFDEIERKLEQNSGVPSKQSNAANSVRPAEVKYRCDENVLPTLKTTYRQITVSATGGACVSREYVTDSGLVIPSVQPALRDRLFQLAEQSGYTSERRTEMIGRSAAEMVLQLLGGGSR